MLKKAKLKLTKNNDKEIAEISYKRSTIEENYKLKGLEKLERNVPRNRSSNKMSKLPVDNALIINSMNTNKLNNGLKPLNNGELTGVLAVTGTSGISGGKFHSSIGKMGKLGDNPTNPGKLNSLNNTTKPNPTNVTSGSTKTKWKAIDDEIIDNPEFRRTIRNEKIEIDCEDLTKSTNIASTSREDDEELQYYDLNFLIEEYNEVYYFLRSIKLQEKYFFDLINDGWDDINGILLIEKPHLDLMDIEEEDKKVILCKIEEIKKKFLERLKANSNNKDGKDGKEIRDFNKDFAKEKEQRLNLQKALREYRDAKKSEHENSVLLV